MWLHHYGNLFYQNQLQKTTMLILKHGINTYGKIISTTIITTQMFFYNLRCQGLPASELTFWTFCFRFSTKARTPFIAANRLIPGFASLFTFKPAGINIITPTEKALKIWIFSAGENLELDFFYSVAFSRSASWHYSNNSNSRKTWNLSFSRSASVCLSCWILSDISY